MMAGRRGVLAGGRHHDHEIGGVDFVDQILGAAGEIVEPAAHREALAGCCGAPENAEAVRNVARCHGEAANSLTMRSLGASSAITLTARACEFGRSMRNFASAAELIRADSLCMIRSPDASSAL